MAPIGCPQQNIRNVFFSFTAVDVKQCNVDVQLVVVLRGKGNHFESVQHGELPPSPMDGVIIVIAIE
jgi:hypothetical protein